MVNKSNIKITGIPWRLADVWNLTLDNPSSRPYIPRDYMYASELGGAFCDRYLKMYGVKMTNPPNTRSLRKFQAGNIWEWVLGMILISAGMLKKRQLRVETRLPRMLRVSGRLDYTVGSPTDWNAAKESVKKVIDGLELLGLDVPPFFFTAIDKFIDTYKGKMLADVVAEIKSLSSFMMEKVQNLGEPLYHHKLQDYHYVKGNDQGILSGKIWYVGKDDCFMEEFDVVDSKELFELYREDIRLMTKYYNNGFNKRKPTELMPEREPLVLFDEGLFRFSKNWNVEYSPFLTYLYNYETPEKYRFAWQRKVASWNRVMKRCVLGDNITAKNKEVIEDALEYFPKWDKYVALAKKSGAFQKPEENDNEETE